MCNLRKLMLLASMVLAAMALAAPSAMAEHETPEGDLTVTNEDTATSCGTATRTGTDVNDGCLIHAESEGFEAGAPSVVLRKHVFGVESTITTCHNEFFGRVGGNAAGWILEQQLSGAGCTRAACDEVDPGESRPWHAVGHESLLANDPEPVGSRDPQHLTVDFCVEPVGPPHGAEETCIIEVPFTQFDTGTTHTQEFGHGGGLEMDGTGLGGFRCEIKGHWQTETGGTHDGQAEQEVQVAHV